MKIPLKDKLKNRSSQPERPSRITNETVAEHRERILAGGRKFKYPIQYSKHKLVINSVLIGIASLVLLAVLIWHQLYVAQNTSKFIYRVTQLLPVPVASVDGSWVRYSDYLRRYRSSIHWLQTNDQISLNSEDGRRQMEFRKRAELTEVKREGYAKKLASELDVSVSDEQVDNFIESDIAVQNVSMAVYERTVLNALFDWSLDDYRHVVRSDLLQKEVSFAIDEKAREKIQSIHAKVNSRNFDKIAQTESEDEATKASGGRVGKLRNDQQDPNKLIAAARKLNKNQISDIIKGSDGYYIIKLLDRDDQGVEFAQIKVALTEFDRRYEALEKDNKIKEFIAIKEEQ